MRLVLAFLLKIVHVFVGGWIYLGWVICQTPLHYAMHVATCASVAASWVVFGHCLLTVWTNRLEGVPDTRPFVPLGLERGWCVYACTALSAGLSLMYMT